MAKDMLTRLETFPLVTSRTTPVATSIMPIPLFIVIFSPKKNRDRMTMKTGKVMEINERLRAVVVWPARYISVLNVVIPSKAVIAR